MADEATHGAQVTGTLTARGNDSAGVAGLMWRTQLHLFQLSAPNGRGMLLSRGFPVLAGAIRQANPRVLVITADDIYLQDDTLEQASAVDDLADEVDQLLLAPMPNLSIVVAAGNEMVRDRSAAQYRHLKRTRLLRSALLQLRSKYPDQILVVTGTTEGDTLWRETSLLGSNFFPGATDIAAPGHNVFALGAWTGGSHQAIAPVNKNGTSFSAPMVGGVAAQLLAMDPTLTAQEVKAYLLAGAQEPKQNRSTGAIMAASAVPSVPSTVYELDAYGSLTKLSRERSGIPVCGVDVVSSGDKLAIQRAAPEPVAPNAAYWAYGPPSIAQGGRRMAATMPHRSIASGLGTYTFRLQQGQWVVDSVEGPTMIQYLEQDTAYIRLTETQRQFDSLGAFVYQMEMHVRIGSERSGRAVAEQHVTASFPVANTYSQLSWGSDPVAPTGDWVLLEFLQYDTDYCTGSVGDVYRRTVYGVPLRGSGTVQTPATATYDTQCGAAPYPEGWDEGGVMTWRDDGSAFVRANLAMHASEWVTDLRRYLATPTTMSASGTATAVAAAYPRALRWDPEGGRVQYTYSASGTWACAREGRRASDLSVTVDGPVSCEPPPAPQAPRSLLASGRAVRSPFARGLPHPDMVRARKAAMEEVAARRRDRAGRVTGMR